MAGIAGRRWLRIGHGTLCVAVLCVGVAAATDHHREDGPCGAGRPTLGPADVVACLGDDVAHVTTPVGSGSAVLLPDGRLVTNAHVVAPFAAVRLDFRDGETVEDVPVAGVDLLRDIAVLGPIDRNSDVVLADHGAISSTGQGDPLFLVGYPGDVEPDHATPAISQGIYSRERIARRIGDLRYLQTDASIGGGQSGGALVDGEGRVAGISGLSFAGGFALALSSPDVVATIEQIEEAGGDEDDGYQVTGVDQVESGSYRQGVDDAPLVLSWPAEDEEREVQLHLDEDVDTFVEVTTLSGQLLWDGDSEFDDAEFTIPPHEVAIATLYPDDLTEARYRTSEPATEHRDEDDGEAIGIDTRLEGTIGTFEPYDTYEIELERGQAIDVYVGAIGADMAFAIYPKRGFDQDVFVDNSGEGFFGIDAHQTFTAERDATYVIEVASLSGSSIGYVLDVRKG